MNQAFGSEGKLTDPSTVKGEKEGTRAFFAGAYAILRNPSGHREVNYDDVSEGPGEPFHNRQDSRATFGNDMMADTNPRLGLPRNMSFPR
jgi:Protein of unknown function (Hypoth_ymh)